mmetsp:Transcript_90618/g.233906  ORF Transcript_90618/g.233906 Transcript_90618/m.233906 type:complete len:297 (-) Transcript_90618:1050-1940(-)
MGIFMRGSKNWQHRARWPHATRVEYTLAGETCGEILRRHDDCGHSGRLLFSSTMSWFTFVIASLNSVRVSSTMFATSSSRCIVATSISACEPWPVQVRRPRTCEPWLVPERWLVQVGEPPERKEVFLEGLGLLMCTTAPGVLRSSSWKSSCVSLRISARFFSNMSTSLDERSNSLDCAGPSMRAMPSKNSLESIAPSPVSRRSKISLQFCLSMPISINWLLRCGSSNADSNSGQVSSPLPSSSNSWKMALNLANSSCFAFSIAAAMSSASLRELLSALSTMMAVTRFIITITATAM